MPEIQLSEGLDTREDAEKIARGLWAEAVRRGWESEYRDIIINTEGGEHIPTVGNVSTRLAVTRNMDNMGETGVALRNVTTDPVMVTFTHSIETSGGGGECCCPDDVEDPRSQVLFHAREVSPGLPVRLAPLAGADTKFERACSSRDCANG